MDETVRVMVIADNRLLRDALAALLNAQPDFRVVAAIERPDAGLRRAGETKPDVIVVVASLGNHSSHPWVQSVRTAVPESGVVVVDMLPVKEEVVAFARAGASGFVAKGASADDVVATVRSVAGGAGVAPAAFTDLLCAHIAQGAVAPSAPAAPDAVLMSKRQRDIIELLAEGLSNKEIAQRLNLATATVKSHVHSILEKLAVRNRVQVAAHARRAALGKGSGECEETPPHARPFMRPGMAPRAGQGVVTVPTRILPHRRGVELRSRPTAGG